MVSRLLDLVLPRRCLGCGLEGRALCADCARSDLERRYVLGVGTVFAAGRYQGGVRRAVVGFKERDRRDVGAALALLLAGSLRAAVLDGAGGSAGTVFVPVPSSRRAARDRGGDHVARLTRAATRIADPARALRTVPALRLGRTVRDSAGLGIRERRENLAGAFVAASPPPGRPVRVVLVDDVLTTGATLAEAARALTRAGWVIEAGAVIAHTPRRAG